MVLSFFSVGYVFFFSWSRLSLSCRGAVFFCFVVTRLLYISEAKKSAAVDFADFWCVLSRSVFGAWAGGPARAPGVL